MKGEISGRGEVGTGQTSFQFSKLLRPDCTSIMDSQRSHQCLPGCQSCHVQMGKYCARFTWTIISEYSQTEISFLFLSIPSQKIPMVFLLLAC